MTGNKNIGIDRNGRTWNINTRIKTNRMYRYNTIPVLLALQVCVEEHNMMLRLWSNSHIFGLLTVTQLTKKS